MGQLVDQRLEVVYIAKDDQMPVADPGPISKHSVAEPAIPDVDGLANAEAVRQCKHDLVAGDELPAKISQSEVVPTGVELR